MRRMETYGLAVFAGIVALLPLGPAWIISMPIGIWTLIVLSGQEVKDGFRAKRRGKQRSQLSQPVLKKDIPAAPSPIVDQYQLVNVKQQLFWPGLGMAAGGSLGILGFLVGCLGAGMVSFVAIVPQGNPNTPVWSLLVLLLVLAQLPWSLIVMLAGMKMMRMESYGLALAGAWISLLPIGPAALITMPLGIWAIVVLSSNEVREAFRAKRMGTR